VFVKLGMKVTSATVTTGAVMGLLLGGTSIATAEPATSINASAAQGIVAPETVRASGPGAPLGVTHTDDAQVLGSLCRTHNPSGSGSARACRTWTAQGGGHYRGTWSWTGSSGVYVQGSFDGIVVNLAHTGSYSGVKKFVTRGCKAGACTAWS